MKKNINTKKTEPKLDKGTGFNTKFHVVINGAHEMPGHPVQAFSLDYQVQFKVEYMEYAVREIAAVLSRAMAQVANSGTVTGQATTEAPVPVAA